MNKTEYCEALKAELAVSPQDLACRDGLGEIDFNLEGRREYVFCGKLQRNVFTQVRSS